MPEDDDVAADPVNLDRGEIQAYLETLWHRVDDDADAARLTLVLDLIEAIPTPEAWAFAVSRAETLARRTGLPTLAEWRVERR